MRLILFLLLAISALADAREFTNNSEWSKTNFKKHNVDFAEIISGGPPKDGIPAIDNPQFVSVDEAGQWIKDKEPLILVEREGKAKAYPLQILMYHEIVNDSLAGTPISVTFCPLCNASIVFHRKVGKALLDFGTTGRLRNSDLIMYDRQTESWWQQFTGEAIIGDYTGTELNILPSAIVSFLRFKQLYPAGKVLSRKTGYQRPYGNNPYVGYDDINNKPFLLTKPVNNRLPPMERVISVTIAKQTRLYPFELLEAKKVLNDKFMQTPLVIIKSDTVLSVLDKSTISQSKEIGSFQVYSTKIDEKTLSITWMENKLIDEQTGSEWSLAGKGLSGTYKGIQLKPLVHGQHFAFAWLAFNPSIDIFKLQ